MASPAPGRTRKRKASAGADEAAKEECDEDCWSRNSVLSQSLVAVLNGLVESEELTDREAIQILLRFDKVSRSSLVVTSSQSFDRALRRPPTASLTPDQLRVSATVRLLEKPTLLSRRGLSSVARDARTIFSTPSRTLNCYRANATRPPSARTCAST